MTLSVTLITLNEEKKLSSTLESVKWADEIIVVDNGSTDRTLEIARHYGAKIFSEPWKGFSAQKNSAIEKATCDWVLSLDADEAVEPGLAEEMRSVTNKHSDVSGYFIPRKNILFGRWIKHGGWYPDPKLRLVRRGRGWFVERRVHKNYCFRLGFLDGKEGFVLHVNHSVQVFWKYAKAWELGKNANARNERSQAASCGDSKRRHL